MHLGSTPYEKSEDMMERKEQAVSLEWIIFCANYTSLNSLGHGTSRKRFVISMKDIFHRTSFDDFCFPGW